jgi:WD40 repeat protein
LPEEFDISAMDASMDGRHFFVGSSAGEMFSLDLREGKQASDSPPAGVFQGHKKRINSLQLDPSGGHLIITSGSDREIRVWDVRRLKEPVNTLFHQSSCHAAFFAPDNSHVSLGEKSS